ncbi:aminotransferase class I/II-fold pyridoxal phosphate-dependent enzyme [Abyssisolibacter fermentans]|uniref:aminotransferase class I/II-fold pyridoxal phosphate-dependent enzyme n=1 Tax=Abyssisolibacter fermentans TaxID=1766203 RepID=UPI00082C6365|nr:aminotransferase class V-fold PLP-dependent enzyme [Abyssisolibacter fermentans]
MKTSLLKGLNKYTREVNTRFHMPGHKGKELYSLNNIFKIDVTEVEGTDNLHNPKDIIMKSQNNVSDVYNSRKTFYCINGTTGGIYAAILSVVNQGDKILVQRNCHISVYNALVFGRLKQEYIYPEIDRKNHITGCINHNELDKILSNDKSIKAVIITNPSYYGVCSDIINITKIVHEHGRILIVDEAHGAHLRFHMRLPMSAVDAKADIVIQSAHKTLPAFTQTSLVHVCTDRVNVERLKKMLALYQTTSPSYILMSSIEASVDYMDRFGNERLDMLIKKLKDIKVSLKKLDKVRVLDIDSFDDNNINDFDETKLLISLIDLGITGPQLENILRTDYGIQVEMADYIYILAMITVADEPSDLDKLKLAIEDIVLNSKQIGNNDNEIIYLDYNKPEIGQSMTKAFYSDLEYINLNEAVNRVSADFVVPYPPGIPLLCPGEIISEKLTQDLYNLYRNNIQVLGLECKEGIQIKVLK